MKLNKHAPIIKDYTRSTTPEMATVERAKIIVMRKYHKPFMNVNKRNVKILLSNALTQIIKIVNSRIVKFLLSTTAPRVSKVILSLKKL
jgi:hypothetical protein